MLDCCFNILIGDQQNLVAVLAIEKGFDSRLIGSFCCSPPIGNCVSFETEQRQLLAVGRDEFTNDCLMQKASDQLTQFLEREFARLFVGPFLDLPAKLFR